MSPIPLEPFSSSTYDERHLRRRVCITDGNPCRQAGHMYNRELWEHDGIMSGQFLDNARVTQILIHRAFEKKYALSDTSIHFKHVSFT